MQWSRAGSRGLAVDQRRGALTLYSIERLGGRLAAIEAPATTSPPTSSAHLAAPRRYDAIVVGGGHNGLTTAAYMARAGLRVCLLERRDILGGACVTEEVWPGARVSRASY